MSTAFLRALQAASPDDVSAARARLQVERSRAEALSLFARRISHDLSNFATVVRTYSELLLADLPAATPAHADVGEIHRVADAMIAYVTRMGRFARSGSGHTGRVPLDQIVHDTLEETAGFDGYDSELAAGCTVRIDVVWIVDALREVLANAREASPAGTTVRVSTWCVSLDGPGVDAGIPVEAGSWAVIEVADRGTGFRPDLGRGALDPFVTTKAGVRGAGLGLAFARSALWDAGGQLVVSTASDETGNGGRVRLWLPVTGGEAA